MLSSVININFRNCNPIGGDTHEFGKKKNISSSGEKILILTKRVDFISTLLYVFLYVGSSFMNP